MNKLALFVAFLTVAANACAMDLSAWLSRARGLGLNNDQILVAAQEEVTAGKMTKEELELVKASL